MIGFFRNFNLARAIILFSVLGSCYLAWLDWEEYQEVKSLRSVFGEPVRWVSGAIQEQAKLHSKLVRDIKGDQFIGKGNPESYIRTIYDGLHMGDVDPTPAQRRGRGYIDHTTRIRPSDPDAEFDHYTIANFLYNLEAGSRQIKVTGIDLRLAGKKVKEGEIPEDRWQFEATVTNRVKDETTGPAGPNQAR